MRTPSILIRSVVLIYALLAVNICYGESESVPTGKTALNDMNDIRWKVGQITIDEAKVIKDIEDMAKQKSLGKLREIYKDNKNNFLGVVILSNLESLNRLEIISDPQSEFLTFAKLMQNDKAGMLNYLKNIKRPGLKGFLSAWHAHQKGIDNTPQELKSRRKVQVEQFKSQIRNKTKDLPKNRKAEFLFNIIENWKSPLEYEACIPLIVKEYEKNPKLIIHHLNKLFEKHIPTQVPPPYTRDHTVFHELCFIAITINDKSLVDTISPMANSTNPYIAYKCLVVLKWLQEGMKRPKEGLRYPIKYNELKRAYDSRS